MLKQTRYKGLGVSYTGKRIYPTPCRPLNTVNMLLLLQQGFGRWLPLPVQVQSANEATRDGAKRSCRCWGLLLGMVARTNAVAPAHTEARPFHTLRSITRNTRNLASYQPLKGWMMYDVLCWHRRSKYHGNIKCSISMSDNSAQHYNFHHTSRAFLHGQLPGETPHK